MGYTPFKMKGSPMQRNFGIGKTPLRAEETDKKDKLTTAELDKRDTERFEKYEEEGGTTSDEQAQELKSSANRAAVINVNEMSNKEVRKAVRAEKKSKKAQGLSGKGPGIFSSQKKKRRWLRAQEMQKIRLDRKAMDREDAIALEEQAKAKEREKDTPVEDYKKGYYGAKKKPPLKADVKDIGKRTQPVVPKHREGEYDVKRKGGKLSEATKKKLKVKGKARVITAGKLPVKKKEGGARGK